MPRALQVRRSFGTKAPKFLAFLRVTKIFGGDEYDGAQLLVNEIVCKKLHMDGTNDSTSTYYFNPIQMTAK